MAYDVPSSKTISVGGFASHGNKDQRSLFPRDLFFCRDFYKTIFYLKNFWQFLPLNFSLPIGNNLANFQNSKYDQLAYLKLYSGSPQTSRSPMKDQGPQKNYMRGSDLSSGTRAFEKDQQGKAGIINLQTQNFDSFHINFLNQVYFLKAVSSSDIGKSSDITQGVPLLRRYFDVPKNNLLHLFLKETFQKYNRHVWNKVYSLPNTPQLSIDDGGLSTKIQNKDLLKKAPGLPSHFFIETPNKNFFFCPPKIACNFRGTLAPKNCMQFSGDPGDKRKWLPEKTKKNRRGPGPQQTCRAPILGPAFNLRKTSGIKLAKPTYDQISRQPAGEKHIILYGKELSGPRTFFGGTDRRSVPKGIFLPIRDRIKKRGAPISDRCPEGFFSGISRFRGPLRFRRNLKGRPSFPIPRDVFPSAPQGQRKKTRVFLRAIHGSEETTERKIEDLSFLESERRAKNGFSSEPYMARRKRSSAVEKKDLRSWIFWKKDLPENPRLRGPLRFQRNLRGRPFLRF